MNVFELFASLSLDASDFDKGLRKAGQQSETFGGKIKSGLGTLAKVGGMAVAAGGTMAIAFGKKSVDTGMQFDKSMSQVAATMGKTTKQINESKVKTKDFSGTLREFAIKLGNDTVFSAKQAADAMNYMALAGYDAKTTVKMMPNVLNLAAAGNIELASASDMVTDAQSALGLSIGQTKDMVDQMAKASSKSNTSVAQLGEAFLTVGGTAKDLKGGTVELSTALGLLADNGVKGAEGGTALRNILLALNPKSKEAADMMKKLGFQAYDANGNMRPLKDIFTDLNKSLDGMSQQERQEALATIFNKVDLKSVNALLGTNVERWDELTNAIDNSKGAAEKMAKTQMDNLAGDVTSLKSKFETLQIAISEKLTPALRELAKKGKDLLDNLTKSVKSVDVGKLVKNFKKLSPILEGVAISVVSVTAAYKGYRAVQAAWEISTRLKILMIQTETTSLWGLAAAQIAANAPMLITVGIVAAIIAAVILLVKHFDKVKEVAGVVWNAVKDFFSGLWDKIVEIGEGIADFFSGVWDKLKSFGSNVADFFSGLWESIKSFFAPVGDFVETFVIGPIKKRIEFFVTAFNVIKELAVGTWELIKAVWGVVADWFMSNIIQPVGDFFAKLWNGIKEAASAAWDGIVAVWNVVAGWFSTYIIQPVAGFFSSMWEGLKNGASKAWNGIKSVFSTVAEFFGDVFSKAWKRVKDVFSVGGKIFDGIKDGIVSAFKTIVNAIIRGINKVVSVPFNAINNMLDTLRNLSIAGAHPFKGLISRFDVPQIPLLAKGGVIGGSGSAIVGEAGAELVHLPRGAQVTPLNRNNSDFMELTEEMSETQQNTNELIRLIIEILRGGVPVDVDGRDFRRKVRRVTV